MTCVYVNAAGIKAIACGKFLKRGCAQCSKRATRLCDWKIGRTMGEGKVTALTCDMPLCDDCTYVPAEGKDLCAMHAKRWESLQRARKAQRNCGAVG